MKPWFMFVILPIASALAAVRWNSSAPRTSNALNGTRRNWGYSLSLDLRQEPAVNSREVQNLMDGEAGARDVHFFGGSSRMKDHETSATWPLS
ncbi:MAG: hypothetical protein DME26_02420 [Verrucomicrobia bacterium]|nr:MAG: hypothetical protein DME26_02420 [Verrucomicrobiota bacterium]